MRTLLALVRFTTLLAPLCILTFWGGTYLLACINFLSNPRMAVEFRYQAEGKLPVTFTASSYVLGLETGDMRFLRPKATNSHGDVLLYADTIQAVGLPTFLSGAKRAVVNVRNAFGAIVRKPDGSFDIFDYLPEQEGPSGNIPYVVNVDRANIKVVEATGKLRFVQNAEVSKLSVFGVGDRWIASGDANLAGVGRMSMSVQNEPRTGVWLKGQSNRLQLAELFRVFRQTKEGIKTPELMDLQFGSLVVYGPFELFIPSERRFRLYSEATAEAERFRYGSDFAAKWAKFSGIASSDGLQGTLTARDPGLDAVYRGVASWRDGFKMDGSLDANASSLASIPRPIRKAFPQDLLVRGPIDFDGRLAYDVDRGIQANGVANASSLEVYQETIQAPQLLVDYAPGEYRFAAQRGNWRGSPLTGSIAIDPDTDTVTGSIQASKVDLGGIAQRLGLGALSGTGDLEILLSGSLGKPVAHIRASTEHRYAWTDTMSPQPGRGRIAATLRDNRLLIDQAYIVSSAGSLSATGAYDLGTKRVDLDAVGSGVDLHVLNPDLTGIGRFKGTVAGVLDRLRYQGTAELFGLRIRNQAIPVVAAVIQGDSKSVTADNLRAVKGAGQATGSVNLRYRDMAMDGRFAAKGIQLSDFLGEKYLASIDLDNARLGGTFAKPTFDATGRATDIVILGSRVDGASAVVTYAGDVLKIDNFEVTVGDGKVEGYLEYRPDTNSGQADFRAERIPIERLIRPEIAATLTGELSGKGGLTFDDSGFRIGSGEGKIANILLNETKLGSGAWSMTSDGSNVAGELFFGELDRSVDLTLNRYGLDSKAISASLWVRNMAVPDVHNIIYQYFPDWDERILALLDSAEGSLGLSGTVTGTVDNPNVTDGGFTAENLRIGGLPGGNFLAAFEKSGKVWNFLDIDWKGGPATFKASGAYEEQGELNIEGSVQDADLSYVSLFEPALNALRGVFNARFAIVGVADNPQLEVTDLSGSVATEISLDEQLNIERLVRPLNFEFKKLLATNWVDGRGGIDGAGRLSYEGYTGSLDLRLPYQFPFEFVPGAPIYAQLELDRREIKDVQQLADLFDPQKSVGTVTGLVNLSGTASDPIAAGDLQLNAERLVFREGAQEWHDVAGVVRIVPNRVGASFEAKSGKVGSLSANATANIPSVQEILKQFRESRLDELFRSPVAGTAASNAIEMRAIVGPDGLATGEITSNLELSGTVKRPQIKGRLDLNEAYLRMPTKPEDEQEEAPLWFEPFFDLDVRANKARFENATANIEMTGSGVVNGTLLEMDSYGLLRLTQGVLRLPTSRINLEPGGIVRPYFAINSGIPDARLDIEIAGNTRAVGPSKVGQGAQRYDIHLDIRGDLLQDGGLTLNATSSPADLTQDEIFALIGRLDLIEGLASGVQSGRPEEDIRNALYGLTPYYLDPYFSKLATSLGLDYIIPEINTIDGISVLFGKTIGRNLSLSGSRQVTQVNQNYPVKYDLNLTYTFRFGDRADRRRVNFIVGTDEVRPWRIAIEYTFRF